MSDVVGSVDFKPDFFDRVDWKRRAWIVLLLTFAFILSATDLFGELCARWRALE